MKRIRTDRRDRKQRQTYTNTQLFVDFRRCHRTFWRVLSSFFFSFFITMYSQREGKRFVKPMFCPDMDVHFHFESGHLLLSQPCRSYSYLSFFSTLRRLQNVTARRNKNMFFVGRGSGGTRGGLCAGSRPSETILKQQ